MTPEIFAEWFRRQGHRVVRTESSYWYEASRRVYQAFPYHWMIEPGEDELHDLLTKQHAVALRYSTPVKNCHGCISYHAVYEQQSYTLSSLDRRSRQNVRAGLKNCRVEQIPLARLAEEGWALESDTANRQGRKSAFSESTWRQRVKAAEDLPGFEAWGALVDGRLVASLLTFQMEDWCELISQQCHRDFLNARINNALAFVVTQTMVNRKGTRAVFYALQSLDAPSTVDEFKFRMGYRAKPLRQRVVFHPWLRSYANGLPRAIVMNLHRRYPENHTFAKAEGMLRFHEQGSRPLKDQEWPECLAGRKMELVESLEVRSEGMPTNKTAPQPARKEPPGYPGESPTEGSL